MTNLTFDPDNTLAGGLSSLSPREAVRLGIRLCEAVERQVGPEGSYGALHPGNITEANGRIALGPAGDSNVAGMKPDALEFIAPEQFWNGAATSASDVYSIGLVLYTALNGGVMPFFTPEQEHSPENRAFALQSRMKGAELPYPRSAGRELAEIVTKAVAFQAEDRYGNPAALKIALESLPEGAVVPAAAPVIPLTPKEVQNAHSYKVDKTFEKVEPEKPKKTPARKREESEVDENMDAKAFRASPKKKGRGILPVVLILLIIAALIFLLRGCRKQNDDFSITDAEPTSTPAAVIRPPVDESTPNPAASEAPDVTPSAAPVEETTPPEEANSLPEYELFMADVTWEQAKALCEEKGGHLATVRNQEQFDAIVKMAEEKGAQFVWLGAYRAENAHWYFVTGDGLNFTVWDDNEPSAKDADGTREDYLLLWYRKATGRWCYNDMRNDPISVAARSYSGKICYICQYEK